MKKFMLTSIIISAVMVITGNSSVISAHEQVEKDYKQAPYYYALQEWFDVNEYTDEQRESFMADTETLDWILYNDNYWNNGNYSFIESNNTDSVYSVLSLQDKPNYPISGYESGRYFSDESYTTGCTHHDNCSVYGGCGCRSVNNSIQCIGFANFFRWVRTGNYLTIDSQISGMSGSWTEDNIKKYFDQLNLGSHVRLGVKGKTYDHSITIVEKYSSGVKVYDCNWDNKCGVRITDLSWSDIYRNFDEIVYSNYYFG